MIPAQQTDLAAVWQAAGALVAFVQQEQLVAAASDRADAATFRLVILAHVLHSATLHCTCTVSILCGQGGPCWTAEYLANSPPRQSCGLQSHTAAQHPAHPQPDLARVS